MHYSHSSNPASQAPPPPQTHSFYLPNTPLPPQTQSATIPPLQFNRQTNYQLSSALTPRPTSNSNPMQPRDSLPISQSQIVASSSLNQTSRYGNKYSFKRNSVVRSKALSFANRQSIQVKGLLAQQEVALACVRQLAATRRGTYESATSTIEGIRLWNTLSEVYNATLIGKASTLQPLDFIPQNRLSHQTQMHGISTHTTFQKMSQKPIEILQNSQPVQIVQQMPPAQIKQSSSHKAQSGLPFDPNYSTAVNNSTQLYTMQIRQLRNKIEALEQQKLQLHNHNRSLEQNISYNNNQESIEQYRHEINVLREQIGQLSQLYTHQAQPAQEQQASQLRNNVQMLSETVRNYEEQLINAENHIRFLEDKHKEGNALEDQVKSLRGTIAQYREQLEQSDMQLRTSKKREVALQKEKARVDQERNETRAWLVEAQKKIQLLQQQANINAQSQNSRNAQQELIRVNHQLIQLKRKEQIALSKCQQLHSHLVAAQDYILQLQNDKTNRVEAHPDDSGLLLFRQQNARLTVQVASLKDDLNTARAEAEIYIARAATSNAEYEDMESRYKQTVQSLSSRYDQLLDERNSLTSKLSAAHEGPHAATLGNEQADALRHSLQQLTQQVAETQQHLKTAEDHIQQNTLNWQAAAFLKQQHDQQQIFITNIGQDLQNTRRQNIELAERIKDFERVIAEVDRLRAENENLTIIIREKDNAPVSTSLKQIDEVQVALNSYSLLYQESQSKLRQIQEDFRQLKAENERIRAELAKVGELEEYLSRAENFIIDQEAKMNQTITTYQSENKKLNQYLADAENEILRLQQAVQEQRRHTILIEDDRKAQIKRADDLHQALIRAESHIFESENMAERK